MSFIPSKSPARKKRDECPPRDKAWNDGVAGREELVVQADRRIALFGSTMYVVMPKRHAHDPRAQWRQRGRKIAQTREERIRVVSFGAETATFPDHSLSPSPGTLFSDTVFSHP